MGAACARRLGSGRQVILADIDQPRVTVLGEALRAEGHDVRTAAADVTDRGSLAALAALVTEVGPLKVLMHTAGVPEGMAEPDGVIAVNTIGVINSLAVFGGLASYGTAGIFIISMAADLHQLRPTPRWTADLEDRLRVADDDKVGALLQSVLPAERRYVYWLAKRVARIRVHAAASAWASRGARLTTISPGVNLTPQAALELSCVPEMRRLLEFAGRIGTVDEIAAAAEFLVGDASSFMNGSDLLLDGGTIAALRTLGSRERLRSSVTTSHPD
jgi:NAD(P)-dependent dehydrogenase (short-subunit alcohol dehydrogenase family)